MYWDLWLVIIFCMYAGENHVETKWESLHKWYQFIVCNCTRDSTTKLNWTFCRYLLLMLKVWYIELNDRQWEYVWVNLPNVFTMCANAREEQTISSDDFVYLRIVWTCLNELFFTLPFIDIQRGQHRTHSNLKDSRMIAFPSDYLRTSKCIPCRCAII